MDSQSINMNEFFEGQLMDEENSIGEEAVCSRMDSQPVEGNVFLDRQLMNELCVVRYTVNQRRNMCS